MNIFYLHPEPIDCATMHNDKHTIKMILEYCQLLSTAHRVLDGHMIEGKNDNGRKYTRYELDGLDDELFYKATHINHPSAIWCRQSKRNYVWLHALLQALCKEYTFRYGKIHKCERDDLVEYLTNPPKNIPDAPFTEPTPAMPDEVKVAGDSISSYRNYYIKNKTHLASWSGKINSRNTPEWFNASI
jgi:Pyrimidine dimer DNA glycosylase